MGKMKSSIDIEKSIYYLLVGSLIVGLLGAGGYFVYVSFLLTIFLGGATLYLVFKQKKMTMPMDYNVLAIGVVVLFYLLTPMWAVDSGMALAGYFKFLPVFLFFILLYQIGDKKENIIQLLPTFGSIMTVFSFVMMQFEVFRDYVSVAGRLAGFFQYPNTYAAFMLVCLVIASYQLNIKKMDWLMIVHIICGIFGIYMSGSRTVFILTALAIFGMAISKKEVRRVVVPVFVVGIVAAVIIVLLGKGVSGFARFTDISLNSSTLLGRFLYYIDAIR